MPTTARRFYPNTAEWDGTDPASGDVRTCETALPALAGGSQADFGSTGNKTITLDPYTSRATTGLSSAFGWAVDIAGADGMDATAPRTRRIRAGTWYFQGRLEALPVASLSDCTVGINVYRVAAAPATTRTLLFSSSVNVGPVSSTTWAHTTASMGTIEFAIGETLQVTYTLNCTGQVGGLVIQLWTGGDAGIPAAQCYFDVPAPGIVTSRVVAGTVYDHTGAPASGATVKLFRQSDDVKLATTTSDAAGGYGFTRPDDDTTQLYAIGYSDATHHGTTDRDLVAAV